MGNPGAWAAEARAGGSFAEAVRVGVEAAGRSVRAAERAGVTCLMPGGMVHIAWGPGQRLPCSTCWWHVPATHGTEWRVVGQAGCSGTSPGGGCWPCHQHVRTGCRGLRADGLQRAAYTRRAGGLQQDPSWAPA